MRFIPVCKDLSPINLQKLIYIVGAQSSFLANIDFMISFEILNIDLPGIGLNGRTLRELILEIPLRDEPGRQAFLSVDRSFNDGDTKFYFYKTHAAECRSRITTLLPYLVFTNSHMEKGIKACFTGGAVQRSQGVKWDPVRNEVITPDDEILAMQETEKEDGDPGHTDSIIQQVLLDFAEASGIGNSALPTAKATKVVERDNVSLFSQSTIGTKARSRKSTTSLDDSNGDQSSDTPKTVNKSPSTTDTAAMSSLSAVDLQAKLDQMVVALQAIMQLIPKTPENQTILAQINSMAASDGVGNPQDKLSDPGAPGPRAAPP